MAKKSKCTIRVNGSHKILRDIEKMGGDMHEALIEAIELSGHHATTRYHEVIKNHKYSGITEESIVENPKIKSNGAKITMQTGFDISKGGAPAIWLDEGTPKQKPIHFIKEIKKDKVVRGSIGYILSQAWKKLMK